MSLSFPRELVHKLIVFLVCLALAVVTYLNYRASLVSDVNYVVPIKLMVPPGLILTYQEAKEVRLIISGRQTSLEDISAASLKAQVDLSSFKEGNWSAPIQVDENVLREKKLKVELQPTSIGVKLEKLVDKQVAVKANLVGSPPTGYLLDGYQISPEKVKVSGPESVVETITQLTSETVNISGHNSSFQSTVALQLPHPLLTVSPSRNVTYRVTMKEQTGVLTLNVPVTLENLAGRLQAGELRPTAVGVTLSGGQLSLARLGAGEQGIIVARVDAGNVDNSGRYVLPVTVSVPSELTVVKVDPSSVTLLIREEQSPIIPGERTSPTTPILPGPLSNSG